ncbi:hypothetical protein [Microbacterium sp. No. 7]|uniref:hypothetical protein n=1 Tax=Microbacterium sp. No. 7 TaxID=1714373 RepID=UPI0012E21AA4|nr:hypothetical protein [Microbacterium sp. No. 7]
MVVAIAVGGSLLAGCDLVVGDDGSSPSLSVSSQPSAPATAPASEGPSVAPCDRVAGSARPLTLDRARAVIGVESVSCVSSGDAPLVPATIVLDESWADLLSFDGVRLPATVVHDGETKRCSEAASRAYVLIDGEWYQRRGVQCRARAQALTPASSSGVAGREGAILLLAL